LEERYHQRKNEMEGENEEKGECWSKDVGSFILKRKEHIIQFQICKQKLKKEQKTIFSSL